MVWMQDVVVALLVPGCAAFAMWKLMPAAWRRAGAASALQSPLSPRLPAGLQTWLATHARAASGGGCSGCDRAGGAKAAAGDTGPAAARSATSAQTVVAEPIRFHPRPRR